MVASVDTLYKLSGHKNVASCLTPVFAKLELTIRYCVVVVESIVVSYLTFPRIFQLTKRRKQNFRPRIN